MKRHLASVSLMVLLLWGVASASPALSGRDSRRNPASLHQAPSSRSDYRPGVVLVKLRTEIFVGQATDLLDVPGLAVVGEIGDLQVQRMAVPPGQEEILVGLLAQDPRVEYAEVDHAVHATIIPDDTSYHLQWGPAKIQAPAAWDVTQGSSDVTIAIVDTGVDLNHPDLDDKLVEGWDFANDDSIPQDDHGHGTHVAGTAAAETNNLLGVAGISWQARIMPVKVLDEEGDGYYSDVAEGLLYACNNGAQIINLSLGGPNPSPTLEEALEQAYAGGCLVIAAAGNGGGNEVDYPARYAAAIAVAATNQSDIRAGFSDYGPAVEVAAPGVSIYSTLWNDRYGEKSGTSMATPHVAGQAALVWSVCPSLTHEEVRSIVRSTAVDLGPPGWDVYYGYGRIDALEAVQVAAPAPILTVDAGQMIFLADASIGPWPQTLLVGNDAPCGRLSWNAADDADWLETLPDEGQASCSDPAQATVSVDKNWLAPGDTYTATITISSATLGVLESPQMVHVKFVYSATPLEERLFPLAMVQ